MWVKKENIYHKPFYKQKLKMTMLVVFLFGLVFLAYQIFYMNQLVMSTVPHMSSTQPLVSITLGTVQPLHRHQADGAGGLGPDGQVRYGTRVKIYMHFECMYLNIYSVYQQRHSTRGRGGLHENGQRPVSVPSVGTVDRARTHQRRLLRLSRRLGRAGHECMSQRHILLHTTLAVKKPPKAMIASDLSSIL